MAEDRPFGGRDVVDIRRARYEIRPRNPRRTTQCTRCGHARGKDQLPQLPLGKVGEHGLVTVPCRPAQPFFSSLRQLDPVTTRHGRLRTRGYPGAELVQARASNDCAALHRVRAGCRRWNSNIHCGLAVNAGCNWLMAYNDWREPIRLLAEGNGCATREQRDLATLLDMQFKRDEPRKIATARLEVEPAIHGRVASAATEAQLVFLREIAPEDASLEGITRRVASAWIDYYLAERSIDALRRLQPQRGDRVVKSELVSLTDQASLPRTSSHTVSSIGADGRVYFTGGGGAGAWPSQLQSEENEKWTWADFPCRRG